MLGASRVFSGTTGVWSRCRQPGAGGRGLADGGLAGTDAAGIADNHGIRARRAASVAEREGEVRAGRGAIGAIDDVATSGRAGDGHPLVHLADVDDCFVRAARAVAIRVGEHDPAALPPDRVVAGGAITARAD